MGYLLVVWFILLNDISIGIEQYRLTSEGWFFLNTTQHWSEHILMLVRKMPLIFTALFEQNIFNTLYIIIVLTQITSWSVASGGCSPSHWILQVVGTGGWFYLCLHTHTAQWPSSQWYPNSPWLYNTAASVLCRLGCFIVVSPSPQPVSTANSPR